MSRRAGIWIDRQRARIVRLSDTDDEAPHITTVRAEAGNEPGGGAASRRIDGADRSPGLLDGGLVSHDQRRRAEQLARYECRVIELIRDASEIVLLGPGELRLDLRQRIIDDASVHVSVRGCHRCDYLTDVQLVARVRAAFEQAHPS